MSSAAQQLICARPTPVVQALACWWAIFFRKIPYLPLGVPTALQSSYLPLGVPTDL